MSDVGKKSGIEMGSRLARRAEIVGSEGRGLKKKNEEMRAPSLIEER